MECDLIGYLDTAASEPDDDSALRSTPSQAVAELLAGGSAISKSTVAVCVAVCLIHASIVPQPGRGSIGIFPDVWLEALFVVDAVWAYWPACGRHALVGNSTVAAYRELVAHAPRSGGAPLAPPGATLTKCMSSGPASEKPSGTPGARSIRKSGFPHRSS